MEPKGTLGTGIMSDNTPAKVVTVLPWHYMITCILYFAAQISRPRILKVLRYCTNTPISKKVDLVQ